MERKRFLVLAVALVMLFGFAQVAGASIAIPNRFVSTSSESNIINVNFKSSGLSDGYYFGVYDTDLGSGLDLLLGSSTVSFSTADFSVSYVSDHNYKLEVLSGIATSSFLYMSTADFSFYFRKKDTDDYDTAFTIAGSGNN